MLILVSRKNFRTTTFRDVEKAVLSGEVHIHARRHAWPPNHWAYYDGSKLWRFDGVHQASLTLADIKATDWEITVASPFMHPESYDHIFDRKHTAVAI